MSERRSSISPRVKSFSLMVELLMTHDTEELKRPGKSFAYL